MEAYGSDNPGCVRHFHSSILHQQAGQNTVNTTVQLDLEATSQVSEQPNSASARHIPGILDVLADILSYTSGKEWSVHPSVFPSTDSGMGNPIIGSVCNEVESQTSTNCVFHPRHPAVHPVDAVFNELEDTVDIHIPPPTLLPLVLE